MWLDTGISTFSRVCMRRPSTIVVGIFDKVMRFVCVKIDTVMRCVWKICVEEKMAVDDPQQFALHGPFDPLLIVRGHHFSVLFS